MRYTMMHQERHRGAELVCDRCNRRYDGGLWYYARYDSNEYPYQFVCGGCADPDGVIT